MIELKYRALSSADDLDGFECGIEKMDTFIHSSSFFETLREYDCDAYTVILDNQVVGLFAINMDVLDLDDDDKDDLTHGFSRANAPQFKSDKEFDEFMSTPRFHVVDIAYLAIQKEFRGQGIGTAIMNEIHKLAKEMNPNGWFMTVDALNLSDGSYSAVKFYEHFNFQRLLPPRQDTIRMYCTMR